MLEDGRRGGKVATAAMGRKRHEIPLLSVEGGGFGTCCASVKGSGDIVGDNIIHSSVNALKLLQCL